MATAAVPVKVITIPSGKLRRYHNIPWWRQLLDLPTVFRNLVDLFKIAGGFAKSLWVLLRERPDVVFAKGGFVCLPMGYAARLLGIPLVLHDSDTRPGLANRLLSGFAVAIATGAPLENYSYDITKSRYVGVPIAPEFSPVSPAEQAALKQALHYEPTQPLVVVTGGGLGARSINHALINTRTILLEQGIQLYHICGKKHYKKLSKYLGDDPRYQLIPFVYGGIDRILAAADVVVSRASATFTQELAGLAKPAILIPAQNLGDQVKNAALFQHAAAAVVLSDKDIRGTRRLADAVIGLVHAPAAAQQLARNLHAFARPDAARDTAQMIHEVASKTKVSQS